MHTGRFGNEGVWAGHLQWPIDAPAGLVIFDLLFFQHRSGQQCARMQAVKAKHRLKFLQLTDVFLASSLVPAYTVAAFAKRFARIALTAPPMVAVTCLAFIHNLLRRHPSCTCLLHQPAAAATAVVSLSLIHI